MKLSIDVEDRKINYNVEYRKRKTMSIRIDREGMVLVIAPKGLSQDRIEEVVRSKSKWICKKLEAIKEIGYKPVVKNFVNGELFMYLGEKLPLKIEMNEGVRKPDIMISNGELLIKTPNSEPSLLKMAIEKWYRERCLAVISERVDYYRQLVGKEPNRVRVKEQKKRWGSCTSKGNLLFNWRCVMAPLDIIDYVVVHEMCHLIHMNHSKEYWKSVESVLPDYRERREWLKKNGIFLDI